MNISEIYHSLKSQLSSTEFEIKKDDIFQITESDGGASSCSVHLSVRKHQKLVMVIYDMTNENEIKKLGEMWRHCHDSRFFLYIKNGELIIKELPYEYLISSSPYTLKGSAVVPTTLSGETITMDKLIAILLRYDEKYYSKMGVSELCSLLLKEAEAINSGLADKIQSFVHKIETKNVIEFNNKECWLHSSVEDQFMQCLLGTMMPGTKLYRYTSYESATKIFTYQSHRLSSIICMNDSSEVNYANWYLKQKGINDEDVISSFPQDAIHNYIVSLSELKDDLTMWRLYGNDARGVCLEYVTAEEMDNNFFSLAKTSYATQEGVHVELDYIASLMKLVVSERKFRLKRWNVWQHFFKPKEYQNEKEIRLLLSLNELDAFGFNVQRVWENIANGIFTPIINLPFECDNGFRFPLKINGGILGCKFVEKEVNKISLSSYINDECRSVVTDDFSIELSKIENYR